LERSDNPDVDNLKSTGTLKAFANCRTFSGFYAFLVRFPMVLALLEPWAEISERLRRKFKLRHYRGFDLLPQIIIKVVKSANR
jgi:hypothetical protein